MAKQVVTTFAPASVGNVGPGFDVFGLALKGLGDKVTARRVSGSGVNILSIEGDDGKLSRDPSENTAGLAAAKTLKLCRDEGDSFGVEIILHKGLPLNSGLGSSGASAAAAARAVSKLSDVVLSDQQLLEVCVEAEELATQDKSNGGANEEPGLEDANVEGRALGTHALVQEGGAQCEERSCPIRSQHYDY